MPSENTKTDNVAMDPYVIEYIKEKMIKPKFEGQDMENNFVIEEINRVYLKIEDGIFDLAFSQLPQDKQKELEDFVNNGASINQIQEYMQTNVGNLVEQIRSYMILTTEAYLNSEY